MQFDSRCYELANLSKFGENVCLVHRQKLEENIYLYSDVLETVEHLLGQFCRYGVKQFKGVAVQVREHSPASVVLLLSILNHNCYFCPLDRNALESTLMSSAASYLICDVNPTNFHCAWVLAKLRVFEEDFYILHLPATKPISLDKETKLCYGIATSGSTGKPKIVYVPYECIAPNVTALSERLHVSQTDVIFLCAPMTFDPFVIELFLALHNGAALLITTAAIRSAPHRLLQALFPTMPSDRCGGATVLQMTPSMFRLFGVDAIRRVLLHPQSSLRILLLGGEVFPTLIEWQSWWPIRQPGPTDGCGTVPKRVFNIYGITELSCWSTIHEFNFPGCCEGDNQSVSIGGPVDRETQLRIINPDGCIVEGAGEGELQLGSSTRTCYIPTVDTSPTSGAVPTFRSTGDWVRRSKNGEVYYLGRLGNVIKRFGKRLCLESVERKMSSVLHDLNAVVHCVWNAETQKLHCCLTPLVGDDDDSIDTQQCRRLLKQHLLDHEKPDSIVRIANAPLNSHGKIDRHWLLFHLVTLGDQAPTHPASTFLRFLAEVLAIDIGADSGSIKTNCAPSSPAKRCRSTSSGQLSFTEAGGSSFQALSLAAEIGGLLAPPTVQSVLLEMLLCPNRPLLDVLNFLETCKVLEPSRRQNQRESAQSVDRSKKIKFLWRANLGKCVDAAPTAVDSRYVCVGSHSHRLLTLDAVTGYEVGRLELPDRIECKVELTGTQRHLALVGCYDGHLYAFDCASTILYWRATIGGMIKAKPLSCDEAVIVASYAEDYNLTCVCLESQNVKWRASIGSKGIYASPILIDESTALVCTLDGTYACVNVQSGHSVWTRKCGSPIFATPTAVFDGSHFALAEVTGRVHLCSTGDGATRSMFPAGGNIFSSLTVTSKSATKSDLLLFGCYDQQVYCIECKQPGDLCDSLTLLWSVHLGANIFSTPILWPVQQPQFVFAVTTEGRSTLLALDTGKLVADHEMQAKVFSTPCCMLKNKIYFGCRDNHLYCFSIE